MKPAPFVYHAPDTLAAALDLMATLDNARPLAGGQSLMPMMNFRVATPDHLIDLGRVDGLVGLERVGDRLRIGAMTTQRTLEKSSLVREACPLLAEAIDHVGHQQTRNRGTLGGVRPTPLKALDVETALTGQTPDMATIARAAAIIGTLDYEGDDLYPADYRRDLCETLTRRALTRAIDRAKGRSHG